MTEPQPLEWEHLTTNQSPALIDYKGVQLMILPYADTNVLTLSLFHVREETWEYKGALPTDTKNTLASRSAPALIEYAGKVLMVYEGFNPKYQLYWARYTLGDADWEDRGTVKTLDGTVLLAKATPALALFKGVDQRPRVLMTYHGTDNVVYGATYDGSFWINMGKALFHI